MDWYLVHTKPRQEKLAQENLLRQGYECYLPTLLIERARPSAGNPGVQEEPLFPRYLFIRLGQDAGARSWAPIRSTRGVSRLVSFGSVPARVDEALIHALRAQQAALGVQPAAPALNPGERVVLTQGPLAGIEGVFQITDAERRVLVLIDFLSRPVTLRLPATDLCKAEQPALRRVAGA
jgi:transcriptional antiterminator RfaH